jgi:hypothetical protein
MVPDVEQATAADFVKAVPGLPADAYQDADLFAL